MAFTLDTNAIIYYLHGEQSAAEVIEPLFRKKRPFYTATVTEVELFGFSGLNQSEMQAIDKFLRLTSVISLDSRVARIAASVRREHGIKTPDSIIAATALFTGSTLITRNTKDFLKVAELEVIKA